MSNKQDKEEIFRESGLDEVEIPEIIESPEHDDTSLHEVVEEENADITDDGFDLQDGRTAEDEVTEPQEYSESLEAAMSYEDAGEEFIEPEDTDKEEVENNSDINDDLFNFFDEVTNDATEMNNIAESEEPENIEFLPEIETDVQQQEIFTEVEEPEEQVDVKEEDLPQNDVEIENIEIEDNSDVIASNSEIESDFAEIAEPEQDNIEFVDNDISIPQFEVVEPPLSIMDEFCDYVANDSESLAYEADPPCIIDELDDYFELPETPEIDIPELPDFEEPVQDIDLNEQIAADFQDDTDFDYQDDIEIAE